MEPGYFMNMNLKEVLPRNPKSGYLLMELGAKNSLLKTDEASLKADLDHMLGRCDPS
jgi:hypothetical protein